jgi:L-asparaginase
MPDRDGVLVIVAGGNIGLFADEVRREWVIRPAKLEEIERLVVGDIPAAQRAVGGTITLREGAVRGVSVRVRFLAVRPTDDEGQEPEDLDSAQVQPVRWEQLAQTIKSEYSQYEGFVILHGLDTMAYTASALSFMLGNLTVPIVLTGAQRPLNYGRTDAQQNVISSIAIAASRSLGLQPVIPEVCVYCHDTLYRGNRVTMRSSSSYRAFDSPNYPPLAVAGANIEIQSHVLRRVGSRRNLDYKKDATARIAIVDVYPGMDDSQISSLRGVAQKSGNGSRTSRVQKSLRGVLLRTYGMGTAPTTAAFLSALQDLSDDGVIVLNVTQARSGRISHDSDPVSLRLMEHGVVSGVDMTSEAAYAKMVVLLSEGDDPGERTDQLQLAICGEQSQNIFSYHFEEGETVKEESTYFAHVDPARPMTGRHDLAIDDITHVQLRVLGIRPSAQAAQVNRTIELSVSLVDKFENQTDELAKLAEDTLRWKPGGRETVNVAYDVTAAARSHVLRPHPILRLETSEAVRWVKLSIVVFANVDLEAH